MWVCAGVPTEAKGIGLPGRAASFIIAESSLQPQALILETPRPKSIKSGFLNERESLAFLSAIQRFPICSQAGKAFLKLCNYTIKLT